LAWALTIHSDGPEYWAALDAFQPSQHLGQLVCVSHYLSQQIKTNTENPEPLVIPYGVAIPSNTARFNSAPFRVLYCGRLQEEQKRIGLVMEVLIKACRQDRRLEATVVGDGLLSECQHMVAEAGCLNRINFTGRVNPASINEILSSHQAILLMSDYEGLPVALLEAMAIGVVPVVRAIPSGIPEIVHSEQTGLLVSENPDQAAEALIRLANEEDLWRFCSQNARKLIMNSFNSMGCFQDWTDLVQNLHERSNPAYPIQLNPVLMQDLHPILHARYPSNVGIAKGQREKIKTAVAILKAKIRSKLQAQLAPTSSLTQDRR
jgi:glycosyltransferase involved in cell wall biosynthesis